MDMGSKNAAYAVLEASCGEDSAPESLRALAWGVRDISGGDSGLIENAVGLAGRLVEDHGPFDRVALENQLGRFAARNKTVQSVLHASLLLLCPGCEVINVSPQCKTTLARKLVAPSAAAGVAKIAEGKSKKRSSSIVQKKTVAMAAAACVETAANASAPAAPLSPGDARWMLALLDESPKKDDLSDCLLQALHVLERSGHLRLAERTSPDPASDPADIADVPTHRLVLNRERGARRVKTGTSSA
jgi:hypothetical protein